MGSFTAHFIAWLIVLASVNTIMITWTRTETFPGLVFRMLKKAGWHKNTPNFWPSEDEMEPLWLRSSWEQWADFTLGMLGGLLRCKICLSWHVTFYVTVITWLLALAVHPLHWIFIPATIFSSVGITYHLQRI